MSYELSDPTIASQIVKLKGCGADVLMDFTTRNSSRKLSRKVSELEWRPLQFVVSPSNSVESVLKPAGLENAQGLYTTQFTKQAGDPGWANDPEVKKYVAFMEKWASHASPRLYSLVGLHQLAGRCLCPAAMRERSHTAKYSQAGDQPERHQMHLLGITLNNSPENYEAYSFLRVARFEGTSRKLLDEDH